MRTRAGQAQQSALHGPLGANSGAVLQVRAMACPLVRIASQRAGRGDRNAVLPLMCEAVDDLFRARPTAAKTFSVDSGDAF